MHVTRTWTLLQKLLPWVPVVLPLKNNVISTFFPPDRLCWLQDSEAKRYPLDID